jgi:hypothetical protein
VFGIFSLVVLPLLVSARAASPPKPFRSMVATAAWVLAGLATYGMAHFVA